MTKAATIRWPQRILGEDDLQFGGYVRAPHEAKPTAQGLWSRTDLDGRRELDAAEIAAELYPWDDPQEATDRVELHILMLEESGFLSTYVALGREWIALTRPLRGDRRGRAPSTPPPPRSGSGGRWDRPAELSMESGAVERERVRAREGARERARARVQEEDEERASRWASWEREQSGRGAVRPERPMLLDAPPIGCPDHLNGSLLPCGPCGTQRKRHDEWVARQRYQDQLAFFDGDVEGQEGSAGDDDPF